MKTKEKDILKDDKALKEMPFNTPEGYFESMKLGLKDKKLVDGKISNNTGWTRFSIAAAIAVLVAAGTLFFRHPSSENEFTEEDYLVFSDEFSTDVIYSASTLYAYSENLSEEDIIEYLIDSDWEVDDIE